MHGRHALLGPLEDERERSGRRQRRRPKPGLGAVVRFASAGAAALVIQLRAVFPAANRSDDTCRPSPRIRLTPVTAPPRARTGFCKCGSSPVHRRWIVKPNPVRFATTSLIAAAASSPLQISRSSATDAEMSFQSGGGSTSPCSARRAAARSLTAATAASKNPTPPRSHEAAHHAVQRHGCDLDVVISHRCMRTLHGPVGRHRGRVRGTRGPPAGDRARPVGACRCRTAPDKGQGSDR